MNRCADRLVLCVCCDDVCVQSQSAAAQVLHQQKEKNPAFRQFVEVNERADGSSLDSLLSYPTSALMRYMSSLEELKSALPKVGPTPHHPSVV